MLILRHTYTHNTIEALNIEGGYTKKTVRIIREKDRNAGMTEFG